MRAKDGIEETVQEKLEQRRGKILVSKALISFMAGLTPDHRD